MQPSARKGAYNQDDQLIYPFIIYKEGQLFFG